MNPDPINTASVESLARAALGLATPVNVAFAVVQLLVLYLATLVLYRLYFHPLSKFPGPKLTAITRLYEFYYQGVKVTEFPEKIREMHEKYGPIVRISPEELSINDSEFNVMYFMKDRELQKDPWYYSFGFTNSLFTLLNKEVHKMRQGHLTTHFSGAYFQKAFPMMSKEISTMTEKLGDFADTNEEVNLSVAFRKMTNEVSRNFLLGDKYPASKDYAKDAKTAYHPLFRAITYIRHFNFLRTVHDYVPGFVYEKHLPMAKYAREAEVGIRGLIADYDKNGRTEEALLYRMIEEDPSYRDDNAAPAVEEFMELLWGGREVMGHAMTTISFQLMTHPQCMEKLRAELQAAKIDLRTATFGDLQKLPYLFGVCKEGIRMQLGGGFRIPRINDKAVLYGNHVIPAKTPISMCPNFFHYDPVIFPEPEVFRPERWAEVSDRERLEHYWKPFGNGTRSCAGRNMALEVIFRATANVFSEYSIKPGGGLDEAACRKDGMLKVFPHGGSRGLIVNVSRD